MLTEAQVIRMISGKSVVMVGNADWVVKEYHRKEIDAFDVIIRFNYCHNENLGKRCTIWVVGMNGGPQLREVWNGFELKPLAVVRPNPANKNIDGPEYSHILWHQSQKDYERLAKDYGAMPTSGAAMIDILNRNGIEPCLIGFDGLCTKSFYQSEKPQVTEHNMSAEIEYLSRAKVKII